MSRTVSRGMHDAGKYLAPAIAMYEFLQERPGAPLEGSARGALSAMKYFFTAAKQGAIEPPSQCVSEIPPMARLCALKIAVEVHGIACKGDTSIAGTLRSIDTHLTTLEAIEAEQKIVDDSEACRSLRSFINCLIGVGKVALSRSLPR